MKNQSFVDALLLDRPDLKPYIFESENLPDPKTDIGRQVRSIIELHLNVIDSCFELNSLQPKRLQITWLQYAIDFEKLPSVKQFKKERPHWYPLIGSGEFERLLAKLET